MREGTKKKYSTAQIDTLKRELITWKKGKKTQLWIAGGFVSRYQLFVFFPLSLTDHLWPGLKHSSPRMSGLCVGVHVCANPAPLPGSHKEEEERSGRSTLARCGTGLLTMAKEAKGGGSGGKRSRAGFPEVGNQEKKTLRGQKECLFWF